MINLNDREKLLVLRSLLTMGKEAADNQAVDETFEIVSLAHEIAFLLPEMKVE